MWHIHIIDYFPAIKRNEALKHKGTLKLLCYVKEDSLQRHPPCPTAMQCLEQANSETERGGVVDVESVTEGIPVNRYRVSLWGDEHAPKFTVGNG